MRRSTLTALSVLVLVLLAFSSPSFAQPSSTRSSTLHKLRSKLSASTRLPYAVSDVPVTKTTEAAAEVEAPIGIASILPYRTPEEVAETVAIRALNTVAASEADDTEAALEQDNRRAEEALATTEAAGAPEAVEMNDTWQGEVASILPYRETNVEELSEVAEEAEGGEFAIASIVPFDSDKAAVDASSKADITTELDEEAVASSAAQKESEWAKRSRVRRFRLRRWLLQKKLGVPIIYSE